MHPYVVGGVYITAHLMYGTEFIHSVLTVCRVTYGGDQIAEIKLCLS